MTVKVFRGFDGRNSLPMNSPYSGSIRMWSVASGAGAYSHGFSPDASPHEAGAGLDSGFLVRVISFLFPPLPGPAPVAPPPPPLAFRRPPRAASRRWRGT